MCFHKSIWFFRALSSERFERLSEFFLGRLFHIMHLQLITSDKTDPILNVKGIPKSDVFKLINENVEEQRRIKSVR
jgi:hypothetical protein